MNLFENAKMLVSNSEIKYNEIVELYNSSLDSKEVSVNLLIEIKNFMENLRSALDYCSVGIYNKYCDLSEKTRNVYFPYAPLSQSASDFKNKKRIENCIPGILSLRPDIANKIESYQHFSDRNNKWLPLFMKLNNENKHERLTPQKVVEEVETIIKSGSSAIILKGNARMQLLSGASVKLNNMIISGSQTISADSPAKFSGEGEQTVERWSLFYFDEINEEVIPFLKKALNGTRVIVDELSLL